MGFDWTAGSLGVGLSDDLERAVVVLNLNPAIWETIAATGRNSSIRVGWRLQLIREGAAGFMAFLTKAVRFMVGFRLLVLLLVVPHASGLQVQ
jgi:hypothetical protein